MDNINDNDGGRKENSLNNMRTFRVIDFQDIPKEMEAIKDAILMFEQQQKKYSSFGASDTEPDGIFQHILMQTISGDNVEIPETAQGWDIFDEPGVEEAAKDLHDAAKDCVEIMLDMPFRHRPSLKKFVTEYCWRCH
jgi:hypothetical protein